MEYPQAFSELGLSEKSLQAVAAKGFTEPTEIQKLCIPVLLKEKRDLIGQAQTGTGKTAAFALPILETIEEHEFTKQKPKETRSIQALVLVPTRELCIQVCDEIKSLSEGRRIFTTAIYGGTGYGMQLRELSRGTDIVVGTPGRIQDHIEKGTLKLDSLKICVLDEADEMLDMGFIDDIENILSNTPSERRMLCFSATMPQPILNLASRFMKDYELVKVQTKDMTSEHTRQIFYELLEQDKLEALCRVIDIAPDFYGLVFCKTKLHCDELGNTLISRGYNAEVLHGDLSQQQRELIIHKMREHRISVLCATDVAARGLDIPDLTHVVNYDIPDEPESYIHRIGRTGRAGKDGLAVSFITPREFNKFAFIKKIAKSEITKERIPSVEDIMTERKNRMFEILDQQIAMAESGGFEDSLFSMAKRLTASHHPTNVITALLSEKYAGLLDETRYGEVHDLYDRQKKQRSSRRPQKEKEPEQWKGPEKKRRKKDFEDREFSKSREHDFRKRRPSGKANRSSFVPRKKQVD